MKILRCIIVYLAFTSYSFAGDLFSPHNIKLAGPRAKFKWGVNLYAFGPVGGLALTSDYFVTGKIAVEMGAGFTDLDLNHAFTLGARYHVFGKTGLRLTPYLGIYTAFHYNGSDLQNNGVYVPVGLHKIKRNGISWSAELAWQKNTFFTNGFSGGFRLGYRFKSQK